MMVNPMKNTIKTLLVLLIFTTFCFAQDTEFNFFKEIKIKISNPADIERVDEFVSIPIKDLKMANAKFNKEAFIVYVGDKEVPSQIYNKGCCCSVVFVCNFKPNQTKEFSIKFLEEGSLRKDYQPRTYAELAMKFDAVYKYDTLDKRNKFTSDHFENFTKVIVPEIHTDHDALFKYEGPGWESEKVGYRFYLDWRNATDIFGKKVNELVLHKVGTNDVIAHEDSYHEMQEWGMDILKVGKSLGIGSIGMSNGDAIEMVSKTDQVKCEITTNGPIISEVKTDYDGWKVGENKYNLSAKLSIAAGSRITNAKLHICKSAENITTGLAKHPETEFVKSNSTGDWQYIALYGKQALSNDNAGIVLFYKNSSLIEQNDDELNYFVKLKPNEGSIEYKYAAAWEQEPDGIKNKEQFVKYIDDQLTKLNNKIVIEF